MSVRLMGEVWGLQLAANERLVLLALADHAHDDGTRCFPGVAYLAWKTGYDRRSVQRVLRRLEEAELIEAVAHATGGRGRATEYQLRLSKGVSKPPYQRAQRAAPEPQRAASVHLKGGTHAAPTVKEPSGTVDLAPTAPKPTPRRRDELWEAVLDACGIDGADVAPSARGAYNRAVAELRQLGATPEEVARRARHAWFKLTPPALARHWGELDTPPRQRSGQGLAGSILARARRAAEEGR